MNEPETMSDDIIQQDILLDDIKEYRKIIDVLINRLNNRDSDTCKHILTFCDNYLTTIPEDYQYEYKGYEKIIEDINAHKEVIKKILDKLEDSGDNYCYEIHTECTQSYLYQYYYLGNYNNSY